MMLCYRLNVLTDEINHYKDNLKASKPDLVMTRAGVFNEQFVKLGTVKTLSYTLQTYLDTKVHEEVIITIKRMERIVGGNEPYAEINLFVELVKQFSREMYVIMTKEWEDILDYPFEKRVCKK